MAGETPRLSFGGVSQIPTGVWAIPRISPIDTTFSGPILSKNVSSVHSGNAPRPSPLDRDHAQPAGRDHSRLPKRDPPRGPARRRAGPGRALAGRPAGSPGPGSPRRRNHRQPVVREGQVGHCDLPGGRPPAARNVGSQARGSAGNPGWLRHDCLPDARVVGGRIDAHDRPAHRQDCRAAGDGHQRQRPLDQRLPDDDRGAARSAQRRKRRLPGPQSRPSLGFAGEVPHAGNPSRFSSRHHPPQPHRERGRDRLARADWRGVGPAIRPVAADLRSLEGRFSGARSGTARRLVFRPTGRTSGPARPGE